MSIVASARIALIFTLALVGFAQVSHASSNEKPPLALEKAEDSTLAKFDLNMRMALGVADRPVDVLAALSSPLTPNELEALRAKGLTIYHAGPSDVHARGKPDALLALAQLSHVKRISLSQKMRPSGE